MSFILDALKKSEGERQRQHGPALFEVKLARPPSRFPPWAIAIALLLGINIAVLAWFVTRDQAPSGNDAPIAQAGTGATAAEPSPASRATVTRAAVPAPAAPASAEEVPPLADEPMADVVTEEGGAEEPLLADDLPAEEPEPADVYERPAAPRTQEPTSRVTRGTDLGVPTYEQLASAPGQSLPELRLDFHVYADRPEDRFVFVNNRRLREGDALPDGTRVESIVPDGAVLAVRGTRFLLQGQ